MRVLYTFLSAFQSLFVLLYQSFQGEMAAGILHDVILEMAIVKCI